jgi:CXXC-20-CXXC protein
MKRVAAMPACPSCTKTLTWKDASTFWNPWSYPCPHCRTVLEASRIQKVIAVAVVPCGLLLAMSVLWIEKLEMWQQGALLGFIVFVAISLFVGALISWRHTTFTIKSRSQRT